MQPTLEQIDAKLNAIIVTLSQLVSALAEDAEPELQWPTLDGQVVGGERDQSQPL